MANMMHCYESKPPDGGPIVYEVHDKNDDVVGIFPSYWEMMMRMLEFGERRWLMFSQGRVAQILLQKVGDPDPYGPAEPVGQDTHINTFDEPGD